MFFFFFNDTATTEIYTLSLHDALPIYSSNDLSVTNGSSTFSLPWQMNVWICSTATPSKSPARSEEHTSELQSQSNLVCRLLLEKKKSRYLLHKLISRHSHIY